MIIEQLIVPATFASAVFIPGASHLVAMGKGTTAILRVDDADAPFDFDGLVAQAVAFRGTTGEVAVAVAGKNAVRRFAPNGTDDSLSEARPFKVAYSGDGRVLAAGNTLGHVQLWDVTKPAARPVASFDLARELVCSLSVNANGKLVYATLSTGALYVCAVEESCEIELHNDGPGDMEWYAAAAHPQIPELAVFAGVGRQIWVRNHKESHTWSNIDNYIGESVRHLSFHEDKLLAVGAAGVQVFKLESGKFQLYQRWHRTSDNERFLAVAVRGERLLVASKFVA